MSKNLIYFPHLGRAFREYYLFEVHQQDHGPAQPADSGSTDANR